MAASLADQLTRIFRFKHAKRRILLMSAISGGFASVFGNPFAATIFGLEALAIGTINHYALFPCLVAAAVGDRITLVLGLCYKYFCPCQLPVINIFANSQ